MNLERKKDRVFVKVGVAVCTLLTSLILAYGWAEYYGQRHDYGGMSRGNYAWIRPGVMNLYSDGGMVTLHLWLSTLLVLTLVVFASAQWLRRMAFLASWWMVAVGLFGVFVGYIALGPMRPDPQTWYFRTETEVRDALPPVVGWVLVPVLELLKAGGNARLLFVYAMAVSLSCVLGAMGVTRLYQILRSSRNRVLSRFR